MNKNINVAIDDLRNALVSMINESGLPIGVVELICKELYTKVQNNYIACINTEHMKEMKNEQELAKTINDKVGETQSMLEELQNGQ